MQNKDSIRFLYRKYIHLVSYSEKDPSGRRPRIYEIFIILTLKNSKKIYSIQTERMWSLNQISFLSYSYIFRVYQVISKKKFITYCSSPPLILQCYLCLCVYSYHSLVRTIVRFSNNLEIPIKLLVLCTLILIRFLCISL